MNHRSSVDYVARNADSGRPKAGTANEQPEVKRPVFEAAHRRMRPHAGAIEVAKEPRLSQFPSPRGLSEEEQLLVRYVTESPGEAVLVAKEQAERRREMDESGGTPAETKSDDVN
jgi:hypothetical protein